MELPDRSQAKSWEGREVADRNGSALGRCVGVFADTATGVAEWLDVEVEGHGRRFVPAIEAADEGGRVQVRFTRDAVVSAPTLGDDVQLSKAEEIELYQHYGVPVETSDSGSLLPKDVGGPPSAGDGTTTDASASQSGPSASSTAVPGTAAGVGTAAVAGTSAEVGTSDQTRSAADTGTTGDDDTRDDDTRYGGALPTAPDTATDGLGPASAGSGTTVETGEDLPVLDPAAASTPVPEAEVTYVDEPDRVADDQPPAAAAEPTPEPTPEPAPALPPPTLRRVGQSAPPVAAPAPATAPSSGGTSSAGASDLAAVGPLGAIAAGVAAIALVLRAREARQRRRTAPAARADRLRTTLSSGSSAALASAGSTLSGASDAATLVRRQAAQAAGTAAREAARRKARAAKTASRSSRRQKRQAAAALTAASRAAQRQKSSAAAALSSASRSAQQSTRSAAASLSAASSAVGDQRSAAVASLSKASRKTSKASKKAAKARRSRRGAGTVSAVPTRVVHRGRKTRKSVARKLWDLVVLSAAGGGYVMGAKAGRERYDELGQVAGAVAASPQVQSATAAVKDPQRRSDLLVALQQQAASLVGRRGEHRG